MTDWIDEPSYTCPKDTGGNHEVQSRCVESSCGGYDDYKFKCKTCGEVWWQEGPDA